MDIKWFCTVFFMRHLNVHMHLYFPYIETLPAMYEFILVHSVHCTKPTIPLVTLDIDFSEGPVISKCRVLGELKTPDSTRDKDAVVKNMEHTAHHSLTCIMDFK